MTKAPEPKEMPVTLPDKYTPIMIEHLQPFERARCEKMINELKLMETRKRMGVRAWELDKMQARAKAIETNYDRYCLKWKPEG
ncbi:hypothetical protein KSF73_11860 [Burkholderiaceae bacterium DAT-1]|nr:hypothetical protein [Burkholderiaceae bacterium DAT-1]